MLQRAVRVRNDCHGGADLLYCKKNTRQTDITLPRPVSVARIPHLIAHSLFFPLAACGGNNELSGRDAQKEGLKEIDAAIAIFLDYKDDAHLAEALMTKGWKRTY